MTTGRSASEREQIYGKGAAMSDSFTVDSLEQQLRTMYAEKERFEDEFGVSDVEGVISMIRNLEAQLIDLYKTYGGRKSSDPAGAVQMLSTIEELSEHLDGQYSKKSIVFEVQDDKPVLRATWAQASDCEGDA